MFDQWGSLTSFKHLCEARAKVLETLRVPTETMDPKPLGALISLLREAEERLRGSERLSELLSRLSPCPETAAVAGQDELLGRMLRLQDAVRQNESLLLEIGSAMEEKRLELREAIEEAGACPLCGQALDIDHFLEDAHA
jgi:DNA repair exonuclease SbcCD ATPase subunit